MRFHRSSAFLACVALCFAQAAPPKKAAKPSAKASPSHVLPELPAAGASGELLDLDRGHSRAIGPMQENRTDFQATPFPDGRVLVTGGSLKAGTTEWFDPSTRRFSPGPVMAWARQGHRAQLLKDGRLLVVGGTENPAPAEILDPGTWKFQPLDGDAKFSLSTQAIPTEEGLLLIDGQEGKCWLWDEKAKAPKSTGSLGNARVLFEALRLGDGRVLVTGGWPAAPQQERRGWRRPTLSKSPTTALPVEVFNPRKGRWSTWKVDLLPRARHQAALVAEGKVALLGGFGENADTPVESIELLDPVKETVTQAWKLPASELPSPGWTTGAETGLYLPERSTALRKVSNSNAFQPSSSAPWHLANAYLAPMLVPLRDNQLLVLGSAIWGPALERWDPRTRQCQYIGALRSGSESLVLVDGKVLAVGPIVDSVDPKTGNLSPLGRRENLATLLKRAKPMPRVSGNPPFPPGNLLKDSLVIGLDSARALVLGGRSEDNPEGTDQVWIWDQKRKSLTPSGPMKSKRSFSPENPTAHGALKLPDGSVLIWSGQ